MLNRCEFIGNVGQKPEVKFTTAGMAVANFSLACNEKWKGKDGTQQERTEWVRVVAWGKTAELVGEYLDKGKQVYVTGRMQTREWTDKEGAKRYTTEIIAESVLFLGGKGERSADGPPERRSGGRQQGPASAPIGRDEGFAPHGPTDEDVPF
jgi:single-strand DNA-binding protein